MTSSSEILAQLRDIHLPPPPPEAPLWPLLLALIAILLGSTTLLLRYRRKHQRWAIQARESIRQWQQHPPERAIQQYAILLKRIALTLQSDTRLKTLHGQAWLQHLDALFKTDYFTRQQGRVFGTDLYREQQLSEQDRDAIAQKLNTLIRRRSRRWW